MNQHIKNELRGGIQDRLKKFKKDDPLIIIPIYNAYHCVRKCIGSILKTTASNIPILAIDDASSENKISKFLENTSMNHRNFIYMRNQSNIGFVKTVNLAFKLSDPHDVVVINSDIIVPPKWLKRLRSAAYFHPTIATATPFTNNGTMISIPYRNKPMKRLIKNMTISQMDSVVERSSLKLRPVIPTAIGHCMFIKRSALNLVGYFDKRFSPGYGDEVDFSQRAIAQGFTHVLADDLFIFHNGACSFGTKERFLLQAKHEKIINKRYPLYASMVTKVANDPRNSLARAIERAKEALLGYKIAIDAKKTV